MAKVLKKVHAGSPLFTNAHINRQAAEKAFRAGVTMQQIAEFGRRYGSSNRKMGGRSSAKNTIMSWQTVLADTKPSE